MIVLRSQKLPETIVVLLRYLLPVLGDTTVVPGSSLAPGSTAAVLGNTTYGLGNVYNGI